MLPPAPDPASFRDPAGGVFLAADGRVLRTVNESARADFEVSEQSAVMAALREEGAVSGYRVLPAGEAAALFPQAAYVLEHARVPFISYPYEWGFAQLKTAALHHLRVHRRALESGLTLSDASAYNIQFVGARACFIDRLSFVRYEEGAFWAGHRQFVAQFLAPLLLWAHCGVTHHALYRGHGEGVPPEILARLLPARARCSLRYFLHVGALARTHAGRGGASGQRPLPKRGLLYLISQLERWVESLAPRPCTLRTPWRNYASAAPYDEPSRARKREAVAECVRAARPRMVWDMGAGEGEYARLALAHGAQYAVAFDADAGALEQAFFTARRDDLSLLPLFMDAADPSPDQGFRQHERRGLAARGGCDFVMALALVHHLAIGRNIPLPAAVEWITGLAPRGIIEWVEKDDPMARALLAARPDIFPHYTRDAFTAALRACAGNVREIGISETRALFVFGE